MARFGQRAYGWRENLVCIALRLAFRLNSRRRGAQVFATARRSLDASYFFHGLYPPMWLFSLLGRQRNAEFRPPGGGLVGVVHRIVRGVFSLEDRLLPRRVPGTSLIALALLG